MPPDNSQFCNCPKPSIRRNFKDGLAVLTYDDCLYDLSEDHHFIHVIQTVKKEATRMRVGFSFHLNTSTRFSVDVYVPESCVNAHVELNDQELIGYFSDNLPDKPYPVTRSACQKSPATYSTIKPGTFQSVNFRWQSGDVLWFYFYF